MTHRRFIVMTILVLLLLSGTALSVSANPLADAIDWQALTGGGSVSAGGNINSFQSLGQPLTASASGGTIALISGYWGTGNGPTAVMFSYFTAQPRRQQVLLTWETPAEVDLTGFEVYRSGSPNGTFNKVSGAIAARGMGGDVRYQWIDRSVSPGAVYYYALKGLLSAGEPAWIQAGPVAAQFNDAFLPLVSSR